MKLFLVRHAESFWNEQGRMQGGLSDIPLSDLGKEQAMRIATALEKEEISAICSSNLKRAMETAQAIAQLHQLGVEIDPDLREIEAGELEGITLEELIAKHNNFWLSFKRGEVSLHFPGGESLAEVQQRAWRAIQRIKEAHPDEVVVVVSHYYAILTIICRALGVDLPAITRLRQDRAAISILDFRGGNIVLTLLNNTCHLTNKGV